MKIDLHAHFIPDVSYEPVSEEGRKRGPAIGKNAKGKDVLKVGARQRSVRRPSDPEQYIRDMDKTGLDILALSLIPPNIFYDVNAEDGLHYARKQNNALAEAVRSHPDRFIGLGAVPL